MSGVKAEAGATSVGGRDDVVDDGPTCDCDAGLGRAPGAGGLPGPRPVPRPRPPPPAPRAGRNHGILTFERSEIRYKV